MFCCDEYRESKFCPDCGKPINSDTVKNELLKYLDKQKRVVEGNLATRLKHNPEMLEVTKENARRKIERWQAWHEWVLNANLNNAPQESFKQR